MARSRSTSDGAVFSTPDCLVGQTTDGSRICFRRIALTLWFAYDGYLNPKYQDPEYQRENPSTLPFNQIGAPILLGVAIWDGWRMRRRQLREAAEKAAEEGAPLP